MLDELEPRLASGPYLFGAAFTEADIRLFVTLVRFDAAYFGLFKTNKRRIADYRNSASLSRAGARHPGRAGDGEHRPYQAGVLFGESAEPDGDCAGGAGAGVDFACVILDGQRMKHVLAPSASSNRVTFAGPKSSDQFHPQLPSDNLRRPL